MAAAALKRKRTVHLLSDADTARIMAARLAALRLECCVCLTTGWAVTETTAPYDARVMHVASCDDPSHATCTQCLRAQLARGASGACIFNASLRPHGARCDGVHAAATVRDLAPPTAARRRRVAAAAVALPCPRCGSGCTVTQEAAATAARVPCAACAARWCAACESTAPCACVGGGDGTWSRYFSHDDGWPKRRREVAAHEVAALVATLCDDAAPWHHAPCPDCGAALHKVSACNDLRHCERHVCNVCCAAAFPWELAGLPRHHWDARGVEGCPRWDADAHWNAPRARGGAECDYRCSAAGCAPDCDDPRHARGIRAMHAARRAHTRAALAAEFPDVVPLCGTASADTMSVDTMQYPPCDTPLGDTPLGDTPLGDTPLGDTPLLMPE